MFESLLSAKKSNVSSLFVIILLLFLLYLLFQIFLGKLPPLKMLKTRSTRQSRNFEITFIAIWASVSLSKRIPNIGESVEFTDERQ